MSLSSTFAHCRTKQSKQQLEASGQLEIDVFQVQTAHTSTDILRHAIINFVESPQPEPYSWSIAVWISSAIATLHWLVVLYLKSNSMCMFFYELDFRLLCIFIFEAIFAVPNLSFSWKAYLLCIYVGFSFFMEELTQVWVCLLSFHSITQIHSQFVEPIFVVNIASILIIIAVKMGPKCEILQPLQNQLNVSFYW